MTPQSTKDLAGDRRYREIWSVAAVQVARKLTGDLSWHAADEKSAAVPSAPVEFVAQLEFSQALAGRQQIGLSRAAAAQWAGLLGRPSPPATDGPDPDALREVLRQITVAVTTGVKASGWGETQIELSLAPGALPDPPNLNLLLLSQAGATLELGLHLEIQLADPAAEPERRKKQRPSADETKAVQAINSAKMDLLLDVELQATLRFGGRQMPLREVIDLSPGEVVELDRDVNDPVELLVDGKTVAWGEAVVVDGNYGLRITRLVNPVERMAAMRGTV